MNRIFAMLLLLAAMNVCAEDYDELSLDQKYDAMLHYDQPDTALFAKRMTDLRQDFEKVGKKDMVVECYVTALNYYCYFDFYDRQAEELESMLAYQDKAKTYNTGIYSQWFNLVQGYFFFEHKSMLANAEAQRLLAHARKHDDINGLAYAYISYGVLTTYDYKESISNFEHALRYLKEAGNEKKQSYVLVKMSEAAINNQQWEDLRRYSEMLLESDFIDGTRRQSAVSKLMLALWKIGEKEQAARLYTQLREDWLQGKDITAENVDAVGQMLAYYACLCGKTVDAVKFIDRIQNPDVKEQLNMYLAEAKKDYKTAYEIQTRLDSAEIAGLYELLNTDISNSNAAFNNERLKAENQQIEIDRVRTQNQRNIIVIIALCAILLVRFYFRRISSRLSHLLKKEKKTTEELREAKMKMDAELGVASKIQQGMLPRSDVGLVQAVMTPAKEVGGDFYNYIVSGDRLYFIIADVSGKGIPAALFMSRASELFNVLAPAESDPAAIVSRINKQMCRDNDQNMFITMIVGMLDTVNGRLQLCNAGHNPPYIGTRQLKLGKSCPIGLFDDIEYHTEEMELPHGSCLLLYTDGVTEAENAVKELFGEKRLEQVLESKPADLCKAVESAVHTFAAGAQQSDDITVMAVRY